MASVSVTCRTDIGSPVVHAEKILGYQQMTGGTDWQIFGQPFHDAENDGLGGGQLFWLVLQCRGNHREDRPKKDPANNKQKNGSCFSKYFHRKNNLLF